MHQKYIQTQLRGVSIRSGLVKEVSDYTLFFPPSITLFEGFCSGLWGLEVHLRRALERGGAEAQRLLDLVGPGVVRLVREGEAQRPEIGVPWRPGDGSRGGCYCSVAVVDPKLCTYSQRWYGQNYSLYKFLLERR